MEAISVCRVSFIFVFHTRTEKKKCMGKFFLCFPLAYFILDTPYLSFVLFYYSSFRNHPSPAYEPLPLAPSLPALLHTFYFTSCIFKTRFLWIMLDAAFRCLKYFLSSWSVKPVSQKTFKLKRQCSFFITTEWFLDSILYPKGTLTSLHHLRTFSPSDPTFALTRSSVDSGVCWHGEKKERKKERKGALNWAAPIKFDFFLDCLADPWKQPMKWEDPL